MLALLYMLLSLLEASKIEGSRLGMNENAKTSAGIPKTSTKVLLLDMDANFCIYLNHAAPSRVCAAIITAVMKENPINIERIFFAVFFRVSFPEEVSNSFPTISTNPM
ncbi:uncharacterized protein NEMAJ01_0695 [Nematocida major]|uniref:uncharacterized protein n=1 Tax=Nematocida major TaxID=1912982 RepID=UPI00200812D5|nr:uncharacterized protein NEMAJ01_0695 [Nematocida major]KAH9385799.1 hypothetical protein NEMAJ01_0695 [Nematocida major]